MALARLLALAYGEQRCQRQSWICDFWRSKNPLLEHSFPPSVVVCGKDDAGSVCGDDQAVAVVVLGELAKVAVLLIPSV